MTAIQRHDQNNINLKSLVITSVVLPHQITAKATLLVFSHPAGEATFGSVSERSHNPKT